MREGAHPGLQNKGITLLFSEVHMFILSKIGGTAIAAIVIAAIISIAAVLGAIKRFFPERKRKPLKRI